MAFVDWNTLNKQIAEELNTSVNSVKATLLNCQYVATGKGLENYSQAQEEMEKLEEQIQLAYELPPEYMMG